MLIPVMHFHASIGISIKFMPDRNVQTILFSWAIGLISVQWHLAPLNKDVKGHNIVSVGSTLSIQLERRQFNRKFTFPTLPAWYISQPIYLDMLRLLKGRRFIFCPISRTPKTVSILKRNSVTLPERTC